MITKFYEKLLFFITKKLLFLTIAEKRKITETAIFGGYGGWRRKLIFLSVSYHNYILHVKFGCSKAVLKFGSWQLKNGKIIGKK